jgi:hypothetical protein
VRYTPVAPGVLTPWLIQAIVASGGTIASQTPTEVTGFYRMPWRMNWFALALLAGFFIYLSIDHGMGVPASGHRRGHRDRVAARQVQLHTVGRPVGRGSGLDFMADPRIVPTLMAIIDQLPA